MKTNRKPLASGLAAFVLTLGVIGAPTAQADDPYAVVRAFWTSHHVAAEVQDTLVAELATTGSVDAMEAGAEPVSVRTDDTGSATVSIATFADGSIAVSSIEKPPDPQPGQISPRASVYGCSATTGSGYATYKNCTVGSDNGIFKMNFLVNYEKYQGANAKILAAWNAKATSTTGSITSPTRETWRPQSSSFQQAVAKYHSDYQAWSSGMSQDVYLGFWLTSTGATSTSTS
ncbi:hypothetical protein [Oerskovia sp. KBS0722]|uniref:hypothetical protein n=1 Tax=Oerskovia sp. KBS0722 TaxID=1179673 RepID=UPI00110DCF8C|nr:hypothetical protein [Oerskovia sp. KBS0722]QDW62314.1 hypothetical protein FFI11_006995 [Oerskovia sp. KBS0722]